MVRLDLIPDGWEERHANVLRGSHTAVGTIYGIPPGGDNWQWDPVTRQSVPVRGPVLHSAERIRVQRLREEVTEPAGGQTVTTHRYMIAMDRNLDGVVPGCSVEVTGSSDPDLTGQTLWVVDEMRGSLRFERHVLALDHLTPP